MEAMFNELFAVLPPSLVRIVAWLVLGVVYLVIFGALMSFLFGEKTWENAKGHLLADSIKAVAEDRVLLAPAVSVGRAGRLYLDEMSLLQIASCRQICPSVPANN